MNEFIEHDEGDIDFVADESLEPESTAERVVESIGFDELERGDKLIIDIHGNAENDDHEEIISRHEVEIIGKRMVDLLQTLEQYGTGEHTKAQVLMVLVKEIMGRDLNNELGRRIVSTTKIFSAVFPGTFVMDGFDGSKPETRIILGRVESGGRNCIYYERLKDEEGKPAGKSLRGEIISKISYIPKPKKDK